MGHVTRLLSRALDILYPEDCLLCGAALPLFPHPGTAPVCENCRKDLRPLSGRRCEVCGVPLISEDRLCTRCRIQPYAFSRHRSLFAYSGAIRELIRLFKFKGKRRLGRLFADYFFDVRREFGFSVAEPVYLVPVPSRARRTRARGFDHVKLIATLLAAQRGCRFCDCLTRTGGSPQKSLSFVERQKNVRDAYSPRSSVTRVAGAQCILVDDIFTTGGTADACAAVLIAHDAAGVSVVTLAMEP
ncbi:MAG TPA: ComF family protein [Spirochaetia bacterium]|nr:ComF family protein [Spirochaetia bacterium]